MRYHISPNRMTKIKNSYNSKYWWGCWKLDHSYIAGRNAKQYSYCGNQIVSSYHTTQQFYSWVFYPRDRKFCIHTKTCAWTFKAMLFVTATNWKLYKYPFDGWMMKQTVELFPVLIIPISSSPDYLKIIFIRHKISSLIHT